MLNLTDIDIALRALSFSFGGIRLTAETTPYTHPALPSGSFIAVDGFTGETNELASAIAGLAPTLTPEQRLARDAARAADGLAPIEVAVRTLAQMLQAAVAETRTRVNELQNRMAQAGVSVEGLPPLVNYPNFEAAVAAFKATLAAALGG